MASHLGIELHDSTLHSVRFVGLDAVVNLTVYVHSSAGRPGVDAGTGWHQPAEMVVAEAVLAHEDAAVPLDIDEGVVTVGAERFENVLPLPFDRAGPVSILLQGGGGAFRARGSGLRIKLTGSPGASEQVPGSATP